MARVVMVTDGVIMVLWQWWYNVGYKEGGEWEAKQRDVEAGAEPRRGDRQQAAATVPEHVITCVHKFLFKMHLARHRPFPVSTHNFQEARVKVSSSSES